jgi:NADH:ubiquinone oxidoreductase subunit F (NADH-binding)
VTPRLVAGAATLDSASRLGVYQGLRHALQVLGPDAVLRIVEGSGEQGRGGAGFSTGRKWRQVAEAADPRRYVVANGDEGDPGAFVDRLLLERDPHAVIEGMTLCAYAVGASEGVVYIRSEYPAAQSAMEQAIGQAREAGLLGAAVAGSGFAFDLRVVAGRGNYVCGEETALLNAIEGLRGEVRVRPPYPAERGLFGHPTVVNNIETLVNIPWIVSEGAQAFRRLGTSSSPGTKAFCLSGGFARPGIVEAEFGISLRELVMDAGGGGPDGQPLAAVALGGPMGSILLPEEWDVAVDYPGLAARGVRLGHGGLVAIPEGADWQDLLVHWLNFMARESCGKCVPCRLGSVRALELARRLPEARPGEAQALGRLLQLVADTSLCGFGQSVPGPVLRLLELCQRMDGAGP